jgi:hypothetical protein
MRERSFLSALSCLIVVLTLTLAPPALAKRQRAPQAPAPAEYDLELMEGVYGMDREQVRHFSRFGLTREEMGLALYLYSVSGRPLVDDEIRYIARNKGNWPVIAWRFGLPPILLEDGLLRFRRPWRPRLAPPLAVWRYRREIRGEFEEKIETGWGRYQYHYLNRRLQTEERLSIDRKQYVSKYEDPRCRERLEVGYPSRRYEYSYQDKQTGWEIRKQGVGRPITPGLFYRELLREQREEPDFRLSVRVNTSS